MEQTTARAIAAEAKVVDLTAQLERFKAGGLSQGATKQVKSASHQLSELAKTSRASLEQLLEGAKTLGYVSQILACAEKVSAEPESSDDDSD